MKANEKNGPVKRSRIVIAYHAANSHYLCFEMRKMLNSLSDFGNNQNFISNEFQVIIYCTRGKLEQISCKATGSHHPWFSCRVIKRLWVRDALGERITCILTSVQSVFPLIPMKSIRSPCPWAPLRTIISLCPVSEPHDKDN